MSTEFKPTAASHAEHDSTYAGQLRGRNPSIADTVIDPTGGANGHTHNQPLGQDGKGYHSHMHNPNGYQGSGGHVGRFVTPGGHPLDSSQPAFPVYHRRFANPAPLGLLAFGATTFLLSLINVQARHISEANVVVGMAFFYGGLVQLIAGIEEWACGNSFGATAFASYGGFWLSFGMFYIPQLGALSSYETAAERDSALGFFLATWGVVTFVFLLASLKSSIALVSLFFFLDITFWLLTAGAIAGSTTTTKAGGAFGILTSAIAAYTALAGLLTKDTSHFQLPVGDLSRAKDQ